MAAYYGGGQVMTKTVFFRNRTNLGPIQTDEVDESHEVKLVCDTAFSINFKSKEAYQYINYGASTGAVEQSATTFESVEKRWYEIRIKFTEVPPEGLDYSVITDDGDLDPRWVPPGGNN